MGMMIYDALVMAKIASGLPKPRKVLTLGVPTLNFSAVQFRRALNAHPDIVRTTEPLFRNFQGYKDFFHHLGFERVDALDVSNYEGADIIGDLNDPRLAQEIADQYDLVYDSGTLEHVFDASTGLRTINCLVNHSGVVLHSVPANGFMDHGFWQISPNLLRSFYQSAGFAVLTNALLTLGPKPCAFRVEENFYRTRGRSFVSRQFSEALVIFAGRKVREVDHVRIGLQDYYAHMHQGISAEEGMEFFVSFGSPTLSRLYRSPSIAAVLSSFFAVLNHLARVKRLLLGLPDELRS